MRTTREPAAPRAFFAAVAATALTLLPAPALAQPAPTFLAECGELREAIAGHALDETVLHTIEVKGEITRIATDGAVVYVLVCAPPDPRVLCVTYEDNGRKVGDTVIVSGGYSQPDPDHVLLDPCLHSLAEDSVAD